MSAALEAGPVDGVRAFVEAGWPGVRTAGVKVRPDTRELDIAGLASLTPAI
ncbi:hypothetical protein [Streptomyces sp. NPDC047841]|uniref:hypothetical protein n=1 Tax=Streptomyces sp. NPDC047841 TaxID=3154708 RepID=UPI003455D5D8